MTCKDQDLQKKRHILFKFYYIVTEFSDRFEFYTTQFIQLQFNK